MVYSGSRGLVTAICQNRLVFDVYLKLAFFMPRAEGEFLKTFFKMLSFKDDYVSKGYKCMTPTASGQK